MKVLIIEDNPADAYLEKMTLRSILQEEYDVRCTSGLEEAAQVLGDDWFDVILLDLGLPESVGVETVKQLRELDQTTAIVVLTGDDDEDVALRSLDMGAQDYLPKSDIAPAVLRRAMRHSVHRMKRQREAGGPAFA